MRRIVLTMAVSLFSVAAPLAPASATLSTDGHPVARTPNIFLLAIKHVEEQRRALEHDTQHALSAVANQFHLSLHELVVKWQRVAVCEVNGNWAMEGPSYSGIGFSNATWRNFGGSRFGPFAGDATPLQQILVGMNITKTWIPDQYGCSRGGW